MRYKLSCRVIAEDSVEANKHLYVATEKQMASTTVTPFNSDPMYNMNAETMGATVYLVGAKR